MHPRAHGADRTEGLHFVGCLGSSPYTRGRSWVRHMRSFFRRFIPVYTGQIPKAVLIHSYVQVYPHIHGADTKFPKKIPVTEGQLLPPQNPMTESVCIIFSECIFADNTFWSFLMFFRKKRDANGTSFSNCFSIMRFFFLFALNQCISVSIRQYDSTRLLQSKSRTFKDGCKRKSLYASRLAISIVP